MATYIVPPAVFPIDCVLEGWDLVQAGDWADNRIFAGGLTVASYGVKVSVGWPGDATVPERMDHVSEEDYRKAEAYRDAWQAKLQEADSPAGTEAFKFGDGKLLALLGPLIKLALDAWLSGKFKPTTPTG